MALPFVSTKRAAPRRGPLWLIFLAVACITAVLTGTLSYTQLATTNALRQSIPAASGVEAFHRLHASQPGTEQDRQEQAAAFERLFADAGLAGSTKVYNSVYASPVGDVPSSGTAANLPADAQFGLTSWDKAGTHVTAIDGGLPAFLSGNGTGNGNDGGKAAADGVDGNGISSDDGGTTGTVPSVATSQTAEALNLQTGDTLRLATEPRLRVEIAAIVKPDRQASVVLNAAAVDYEEQQVYPILVPPQALHSAGSSAKTAWTVMPDPQRITASELPGSIEALEPLKDQAVSNEQANVNGVVATGALVDTLRTAMSSTQAVRGVAPVAIILLALLGAVALFQLARLLIATRSNETALPGASCPSHMQRLRSGLLASAPVALAGTVVGYTLAVMLTPLLTSVLTGASNWSTAFVAALAATWPVSILIAVAAVVILSGTVFVDGLRRAGSLRQRQTGLRAKVASFGVLVIVVGAAALSLWQLHRFGSPLAPDADGNLTINPVAVAAPALVIVALAAVTVPAIAAATAGVQRLAARSRGLAFPLAARQVARRISSYLVPIVLIVVTIGTGTYAAAYAQTSQTATSAAAHLTNGSDVRLSFPNPTVISGPDDVLDLQTYADVEATKEVSPVITSGMKIGDADAELIALQPEALPGLLQGAEKATEADALLGALTGDDTLGAGNTGQGNGGQGNSGLAFDADGGMEVPLPPGTDQLRLQLSSTAEQVPGGGEEPAPQGNSGDEQVRVSFSAWFESSQGQLVPVPLGTVALHDSTEPQSHSFAATLPQNLDAESLRAIDFTASPSASALQYTVKIDAMAAIDGTGTVRAVEMPSGAEFEVASGVFPTGQTGSPADGGFVLAPSTRNSTVQGRLIPTPPGGPVESAVPIVVTDSVLEQLDLSVGEELTLQPQGTGISARIAAAVLTLPGVTGDLGAMIDITAYQSTALTTEESVPEIGELWFASANPEATAAQLRTVSDSNVDVTTADTGSADLFLAPAVQALWIGAAGALLIGMIALAASIQTLARLRRSEVDVLAALGMPGRLQAASRRWELLTVGLFAVAAGLLTGWLTAALTAPALASSTIPNAPAAMAVPVGIAWPGWAAVVLSQLLILAAGCWFYGSIVRRQFSASRTVEAV
ncbi:ABC transporter permease family protein [Arthrobacter pigmenti]